MVINFNNFFKTESKDTKIGDFQDLDHLDGVSISTTNAKLYNEKRDDVILL